MRQCRAFPTDRVPARVAVVTAPGRDVPGNLRGVSDQSTQSIVINADPQAIMDVIADVSAYPQWALAVKKAEVVVPGEDDRAQRVRFSLDAA
jgi:Polyketide cyclase / dehydrase and lipid transport